MMTPPSHDIIVVDTDVVSFIFKGDTRTTLYQPYLAERLGIIAAQSRAELERWALLHNWGSRRHAELRRYLGNYLFAEVDEAICLRWAEIKVYAQLKGKSISGADAWIAATALAYDAPLLTHNADDFINVSGLTVMTEK
ncbi:MAG TPA: PIN domain-containing protein [Pyrinomonadaceae bacterium]|jgi:tRNA(fMet)-specific endonuclease VapC